MPFKKGQGGRPKGARNHIGREVKDIWIALGGEQGAEYAKQLHAIAVSPHGDVHARLKALAVIAPYVWKRLEQRVELTGDVNVNTRVVHEYHPA